MLKIDIVLLIGITGSQYCIDIGAIWWRVCSADTGLVQDTEHFERFQPRAGDFA